MWIVLGRGGGQHGTIYDMNELRFEEQSPAGRPQTRVREHTGGGLTGLLVRKGIAKNSTQASVTMAIVAILLLALAFFILPQRAETVPDTPPEPAPSGEMPPVLS